MAMKKCLPDQVLTPTMLNVILFGAPALRKTSIAQTASEPYNLDFDGGLHRSALRRYGVRFETWGDVEEIFEDPKLQESQTIVIDTIGRMLDLLAADIRGRKKSFANGGSLSPLGWGVLKNDFVSWVKRVRNFGNGGRDFVYIAHEKVAIDGEARIIRPDIVGGSYSEIMRDSEIVGHVNFDDDGSVVIDFAPHKGLAAKNTAGWGKVKVPELSLNPKFLANLLADAKTKIGLVNAESAKLADEIQMWGVRIGEMGAAEDLDAVVEWIKSETDVARKTGVRSHLLLRAKALGLVYSVEHSKYVPKQ